VTQPARSAVHLRANEGARTGSLLREGKEAGGIVRRVTPWILLVLVTLVNFAPAVARAGTTFVQNTSPASAMKDYLKHQKSERRKLRKSQKKAENHFKKVHQQGH
jgi:uncharacterized membrane protein